MNKENINNGKIYVDGVFDLMHSGHFNAVRQAKLLGSKLVVGINSDLECFLAKGCHPLYNENERAEIMKACKWVDDVIVGTPYKVSIELLDSINCDFAAHGDDPVDCSDGSDPYQSVKELNRLKIFRRTEGVSTTTVITRLLKALSIKISNCDIYDSLVNENKEYLNKNDNDVNKVDIMFKHIPCQSLISTNQILNFTNNNLSKSMLGIDYNMKKIEAVYVDGSFDLFHVGHLRLLQEIKKYGNHLIVGIYDDATVSSIYGDSFPILKMMERALSVLSMKFVDDVIFGAPLVVNSILINSFNIKYVVSSKCIEDYIPKTSNLFSINQNISNINDIESFCYKFPISKGIFLKDILDKKDVVSNFDIFRRVVENKDSIIQNLSGKWTKELVFYNNHRSNI